MVSVSLGEDPRDFALFAFGGAGPLHAAALARELGAPRVLIPARPGLTNALGCVVADLRHDFVHTVNRPLDLIDMAEIAAIFEAQIAEGRALIGKERVATTAIRETLSVDMQFVGQTHLVRVPLDGPLLDRETLRRLFDAVYFRRFRVALDGAPVNLVNVNCSVIGERPEIDLSALIDPAGRAATLAEALTGARRVWFPSGWRETPVYARDRLPLAAEIDGPAIIEQMDATTVVEPGDRAGQDGDGNLLIAIGQG
jgi:N-methylhydantoinase A